MRFRRFRFSLRALMIVVAVPAVPCAYVGWQARIVSERKAAIKEIMAAGGAGVAVTEKDLQEIKLAYPDAIAEEIPSLRFWLSDRQVIQLSLPWFMKRDDVDRITRLFPEAQVLR